MEDSNAEETRASIMRGTHTCPVSHAEGRALRPKCCSHTSVLDIQRPRVSVEWTMATRSCYMPWLDVGGQYAVYSLHLAAAAGNTKNYLQLLHNGMKADALDTIGNTPLVVAAAAPGDESNRLVTTLLERLQDPDERAKYVNTTNKDGLTALHFAVLASRPSLVQLLLDAGADPNAGIYSTRDGEWFGLTPLHFSLISKINGWARCRQLLLEAGADPNVEMACCSDPLNSATLAFECDCGGCCSEDLALFTRMVLPCYRESSEQLSRMGSCVTLAARLSNYDAVVDMLQCGRVVNVDVTDSKGITALSWSVNNMVPSLVQTLINAGANVNHCTETATRRTDGGRPLHVLLSALRKTVVSKRGAATKDRLLQTARILLDCPAVDVNQRDTKGRTPLMIACTFDQTGELVTELLEHGADPDLEDNSGCTALWWALYGCSVSPPRSLSAMLQTRVPRRLLTLPWYEHHSPLSRNQNDLDVDTIRILYRAGFASQHQVTEMYKITTQEGMPDDEELAAKLDLYEDALEDLSFTPRMLQDICILTVVRSLDHLTKPSERSAALESLGLNPGVWQRIVDMGIAANAKAV